MTHSMWVRVYKHTARYQNTRMSKAIEGIVRRPEAEDKNRGMLIKFVHTLMFRLRLNGGF